MLKRVISLLLSMAMVLSLMPMNLIASAEEIPAEEPAAEETVAPVAEESVPAETEAEETASDAPTVTEEVQTEYAETYDAGTTAGGTCGDNLTWTLDEEGTLTISGTGAMTDYTLPNFEPWYAYRDAVKTAIIKNGVTSIGIYAFYYCTGMTSVEIPDSVININLSAFYNCSSLTSVEIPDSVTTIGIQAFRYCDSLTIVDIPDSVISIGDCAFDNCTNLTSVEIGNSVACIGDTAFGDCDSLTSVKIPNSVTSIGNYVFRRCKSLAKVEIGNSVTTIGDYAFAFCDNLTEIAFEGDAPNFGSYTFSGVTATAYYPAGNDTWTEEVMQDYGGTITWEAYGEEPAYSEGLEYTLSEDETYYIVAGIGTCTDTDVIIPAVHEGLPVKEIGESAFLWNEELTSVEIPESVIHIGAYAFYACSKMVSVGFPESLISIGDCAFEECYSLTDISLGNSLDTIGDYAFNHTDLTSVIIPDSVTTIGNGAFCNCPRLTNVEFPNSVTSIGAYLFTESTGLNSIDFFTDVFSSIPDGTFRGCTGLTDVTIPENISSIGTEAFMGCSNLTNLDMKEGVKTIGADAFSFCTSLVSVAIPDSVTSIGQCAFSNCISVTDVSIGDSVVTIGNYAFSGCYRVTKVTVGKAVAEIGECAFDDSFDSGEDNLIPRPDEGTAVIIFKGDLPDCVVDSVPGYGVADALPGHGVTICYPKDNDTWTDYAAEYNSETKYWMPYDTEAEFYEQMVFTLSEDETYYILTSIGTCLDKDIVIPATYNGLPVKEIAPYAFWWRPRLNSLEIPDTVTRIGEEAFYFCCNLKNVVVGESVNSVGKYAFSNWLENGTIYFKGNAPSSDNPMLYDITATAYYPAGNETWTEEVRQNYRGDITWIPYGDVEEEEEKILFAAWDDFSGYLYDFPDLPVNMMTMLVFCFGSEDEYVILSDNLTAGGCITMSPGATVNGNQTWDIWPTEMGPGTVTYTDPDTGKTYTFDFVVTEAWEGGEGPGGEGPGGEVDDSVIRLFTRWDDASGFMESSEIRLDCTSPFVFCFGTYEDHIYVTDLELSGVATLSEQYTTEDGAPGYHLGVSDLGEGFVKYTHTDGVEYTYSVNGILGYPGELIAVCTDPNRGYDGLEFMPYLTVGESLEAEFAVLDSTTTYRMLPSGTVYTTEGTATLEQVDGTVYAIGVSGEGEGKIHYTEGDQSGYMYVWGNAAGEGPGGEGSGGGQGYPGIQNVQYQGQTISVFIGDVWDDELHDIQGYGDSYGARSYHDFRFRFLLGAFSGFESNREALAPAGFYDCISDITFHLEDTRNEFGSSEKRNCWLSNEPEGPWQDCRSIEPAVYENETLGIHSAQTYLRAEAGKGFYATVCMTFTYDDPSDDIEAATYTVKINGSYTSSGDVILDLSTGEHAALVDTAEELNGIVGDYDALLSWMEENFPDTFAEYKPGGTVTLNLPAVEYEDILTVDAKPDYDHIIGTYICLHGSTDENGKRTRLPGILAKAGLHEILDIDFVYDPDVTYGNILGNNKELSYGILADCSQGSENTPEDVDAYWNDICNVGNCTFTGFDYGMLSTEYGYAGPAWGCTFNDCYYGIYMDCKDKGAGGNDNFSGNTFNGSKFAVCLRSLPGGSTPYSMRFHDNMFLKCHKEFKVTTSGNKHYFYFYRNYYSGAYHDGLMLLSEEESTGRAAQVELVDENGVQSTAVVLTDPCRINPDMSVENGLWIFGESTSILNAEADKLLIAQSALNDTRIAVLDSNEEEIALWDFGEAAQTRSAYTLRENSFNAGVAISETEEGSILVTVSNDDQTDAVLQSCAPMLEVDCPFESAYVLYGDTVVLSELADGKIRFEAARGGDYVIISGQPDAEFAAAVGSICYERVSEALAAAQSGETVTLLADSAERDVIVKEGINLDLNGYTLTADYVFAVKGSNIVDNSADNTGLLMVDAACVMISKTNSQLPVWNGEGYLFTTVKYRRKLEGYDADSLRYAFLPRFQEGATALLEDGVEGNKVTIEVRVSWETELAHEYRNLVFNETQVQTIVGTEGAFTLTFSGFSKLDMKTGITVEALVVSETGVSRISNAYVVDVTQAE